VERVTDGEMGVVVQVGAGADDPVDEPRLYQRDDARTAQPRRSERPGDAHPDGRIPAQHLFREQMARFPQSPGVIRLKIIVDEVHHRDILRNGSDIDGPTPKNLQFFPCHQRLYVLKITSLKLNR